jgi:hypothetical protein
MLAFEMGNRVSIAVNVHMKTAVVATDRLGGRKHGKRLYADANSSNAKHRVRQMEQVRDQNEVGVEDGRAGRHDERALRRQQERCCCCLTPDANIMKRGCQSREVSWLH